MKKITLLIISFLLLFETAFATSYKALDKRDFNELNTEYANSYTDVFSVLGIFFKNSPIKVEEYFGESFNENDVINTSLASHIFEKLFKTKAEFNEGFTNEELFLKVCTALNIGKSQKPYDSVKQFNDYGYISKENIGYYESVFDTKEHSIKFLKPHKKSTNKSFFETFKIFEAEIFNLHKFEILTGTVIENSIYNGARTIRTSNNLEFNILSNQNVMFTGYEIKTGTVCNFYVKNDELYMIKGVSDSKKEVTLKLGGIYKGNLYLFDKYSGKMIFSRLSSYQNDSFKLTNGKYTEFNLYGNFITVKNGKLSQREILNEEYIDKDIIFITAIDGTKEFITYVYLD